MTADQFLAWGDKQSEGHYELVGGEIIRMAPERARHVRIKYALARIVDEAIRQARVDYEFLGDGIGVRINEHQVRQPDGSIARRPAAADDALEVKEPVVLFEVVSPSSGNADSNEKLADYTMLPSVQHYVVINPWRENVVHFRRESANSMTTSVLRSGTLDLSPPGISVSIEALLGQS